ASTARAHSGALTSHSTASAPLPASFAAWSSRSRRRAANATRAPARLAARPTSRPTPLDPPITRIRRPPRSYWTPTGPTLQQRTGTVRIDSDAHLPTRARGRISAPGRERSVRTARGGRRSLARAPAARLRVGNLPVVFRGSADPVALAGSARGAAPRRSPRAAQSREGDPPRPLRGAPRYRMRAGDPRMRGDAEAGRWRRHLDHARHGGRLLRASPPRICALRRGVRGRPARRGTLRRVARQHLLRRIDVCARGRRV